MGNDKFSAHVQHFFSCQERLHEGAHRFSKDLKTKIKVVTLLVKCVSLALLLYPQ